MPLDLSAVDRFVQELARQEESVQRAAQPRDGDAIGPWPYVAMFGGHGLDTASTLNGWRRGLRETNPIIGDSKARLLAAKGASSVGTALLMRLLDKRGHDKAAKWVGYGTGAAMGAIGARNFMTGRK